MAVEWLVLGFFIIIFAFMSIKIVDQYERAVKFRLGKYVGTLEPGLNFVIPVIERIVMVDIRLQTIDIPAQQVITKDNVPVQVNGVIYFKVSSPEIAIIKIQNFGYAISQYAQTALKDVVGGMSLDQLLAERDEIGKAIEQLVEKETKDWGMEVEVIKMQDIDMPEELKRIMSRQAAAEREKRANITKSEGDKLAAVNLAAAAKLMAESPGAMQLRTLQTIDGLGPTPSNTVVMFPIDILETLRSFSDWMKAKKK
ncbi:MAG TPA: SPFH domain-containing protein [Candidatus Norongarragalinales archaeon]|nr:SPFH domain-containing protein [Candidatus Norongarragalinales archaeon]